ncbi:MAG: type I-MYXAN CRISPR-associated protein Cas5/Cmx5/DevS [Candidatus Tectomicrobia bacterium]|uniref:Type I-MYXAN CRISPR-associated protein Cas5/Cmx5/DevS n=1 Tax=Tectimicrobiota bacterium TaxID=2528274 RepID=A0A938B1Z4_UNCTE|nr:type I-MYXAN CRISPR-associated protein Cas5/Cmx5/DevS [Candidatus Tectomicrobia bacterium]
MWLRVRAPFAAFRWFQAGVYRATTPVMPPSAAYGLLLNLAAIEMRDHTAGDATTTLIRPDLPVLRLALGVITPAERGVLYQQLHTYPVGDSGAEFKPRTHGAKYWITPAKREILIDLDCVIGAQAEDSSLFDRVRQGLRGNLDTLRYGLPFAGDNNFLIDRIDELSIPPDTSMWYARMQPDDPPRKGSCRLTVGIDRADNSKTTSLLYAPTDTTSSEPPVLAWTWTPREPTLP